MNDLEKTYLDATRFPLTTQKGLDLLDQKILDAHKAFSIREWEEAGNPLTDRQKAIVAEIEEKRKLVKEADAA